MGEFVQKVGVGKWEDKWAVLSFRENKSYSRITCSAHVHHHHQLTFFLPNWRHSFHSPSQPVNSRIALLVSNDRPVASVRSSS